MQQYEYVTRKEYQPIKNDLIKMINLVQDEIRDQFTFSFTFVGSSSRNMITRIKGGNRGYDFDINIHPNDDEEHFTAKQIKHLLMDAFNKVALKYLYDYCEDSTRVFTIKVKDRNNSKILYSCDFAVVYDCQDGRQQYIRFNKDHGSYSWQYQPKGFYNLDEKFNEINKYPELRDDLNKLYLHKKNTNNDPDKKSRSLFAESVNEIYNNNFND